MWTSWSNLARNAVRSTLSIYTQIQGYSTVPLTILCNTTCICACLCTICLHCSVLWCSSKGIRPVKTEWWGIGVVICLKWLQMICIWFSWCHCHPIISCCGKIQNGLPFWCRLTHVVLEKRLLNGCSSSVVVQSKAVVPCQNKIILKNFRPIGRPS